MDTVLEEAVLPVAWLIQYCYGRDNVGLADTVLLWNGHCCGRGNVGFADSLLLWKEQYWFGS